MIETKDLELVVEHHVQGELVTNAKKLREFVLDRVKDYTPDNYVGKVAEAKADRTVLNKAAKELNDKRLELERRFMEPFQEFKSIIGETVTAIKDASYKVGVVINEVEQRERDERKAAIQAAYDESGFTLVPLDRIMDQRWLNKSTSTTNWRGELRDAIEKVTTDLESLTGIGEDEETVKALYLDTLDIGRALQHGRQLRERREALARVEAERQQAPPPVVEGETVVDSQEPRTPEPMQSPVEEEVYTFVIEVSGTQAQMSALRRFIDENGITYRKLEVSA